MGFNRKRQTIRIHMRDVRKPRRTMGDQTEKVMTSPSERRKTSLPKKDKWQEDIEDDEAGLEADNELLKDLCGSEKDDEESWRLALADSDARAEAEYLRDLMEDD